MLKWSKRNAAEALMSFYQTVERAVSEDEMKTKKWRGVQVDGNIVYAFYGEKELSQALAVFMDNPGISNRYLSNAVEGIVADRLIAHKLKNLEDPKAVIDTLVTEIADSQPEVMRVYMPVYGVSIPSGGMCAIGDFVFIPPNGYDALGIKTRFWGDVKERMWENLPHVAASVSANDPNKAKEKALKEFQWLENAVRLFVDSDFYDFGITSYNFSRVENAFVATEDGQLRGMSSQLKGSPHPMAFGRIFDPQKVLYKVVNAIGRRSECLSPFQCRIRQAVYLGGLSVHETSFAMSYFLAVSALEALFQVDTDKYVSPSIAQQIVESFCYLVVDEKHRRKTFDSMRVFYRNRSAVAHGGNTELTKADVLHVREYVRAAVIKMLFDPALSQVRTPQDLAEVVKDLKFGCSLKKRGV